MILAIDVDYREDKAFAAGVLFEQWEAAEPTLTVVVQISEVEDYQPGSFYKRELPCILKLLMELEQLPDYIVIDGYVYLDKYGKCGLGKYLYDALQEQSVVIGVAKSRFKDTPTDWEVYRGDSQRPLYVNAVGTSNAEAKDLILKMYGEHRIPVLLKMADYLSKHGNSTFKNS
jgi:deoxyribonuclease V